jgi:aspartyl-tRNA(Asn)/glutamyl-tRNA(Gln) amidotransferase subunit A
MTIDLSTISAASLGRLYANGTITPAEATEWVLDRIAKTDDKAIFISTTPERARREAAAATERYRRGHCLGPLDGVPLAWKDLFDIAGTVTTAGSDVYRTAPPAKEDAPCVRMAAQAGLVSVGKVNLTEFAFSALGLNPHFSTPRNPRDQNAHRSPGGSSSGSAVAVASGLVPCAIGSDTGGSVRIPAAFNGIVGLKTAEGRIDKRGVFPLSKTLDTVGPLARTVEDCVALECAMRDTASVRVEPVPLAGLRFVAPMNVVRDGAEDAVLTDFARVLDELKQAGAIVVESRLDSLDELQDVMAKHGSIAAAEAYAFHKPLMEGPDRGRVDPRVVTRIMRGGAMSAEDLQALHDARQRLRKKIAGELEGALLLMPTVAHVAPLVAPLERDAELFHAVNAKTLRNTMIGNMLDLPGFALPSGAGGLPTSILVSALSGDESALYPAAATIEALMATHA